MSTKSRLISGRVPVTSAANVAANRYQYLDLSSAEPNLGTGNTGDVLIYDSSLPGGRKWIPQGDIRGSIGESAYIEANTASANTLYLSGVDNSQNNRITVLEGINPTQNARMAIIEGVDATQNTNITAVNTFAQSAYDTANTKFNSSGGTITGSVTISANNNLTVTGNLTVLGNTFSVATQTLEVTDPFIILGIGNYTTDAVDIGFAGHYNNGANAHTGLLRDYATKDWYLFQGYTPELSGNNELNISHASFDTANLIAKKVTANVVASSVTIGGRDQASVDATQNTNITIANNAAQAAFAQANATAGGLTSANSRITISEGVDVSQNTRMSIIEGVDTTQNTRLTIIEGVDTAQNTRITIAEGVDVWQNTRMTIIEGVDLWQNTQITAADTKAQAAFNAANTAGGADAFARQTANAAFTQANTATTLAQAAFNKANTSVDAVLTSTVDTFTGDGSTVAYTLSTTPATINYTTAVVGGVTQPRSAYSVVGTTLTFTSAPANTQIIEVTTIGTSNTTLYTVNNIISPFLLMGA